MRHLIEEDMLSSQNPDGTWAQTFKVLALLIVGTLVFSYLGAFAVTNALATSGLIEKWPPGHDPRPRWMMLGFTSVSGAIVLFAAASKWSSWRQSRRVDAMADDDG